MKKLYFNLNTNLRNTNLGQVEKGDFIELEITLLQDVDYSNASFRLLAEKSDNNRVEQKDNYILLEGKITFKLKKEFLSYPGIVKMELNIADKGKEYTTSMFYIRVSDTINSNIIESIEDVETLKELEDYVKNANNTLDNTNVALENLEDINNKIIPVENKRNENELVRTQNEKNRNENERDRITAEKVRKLNEENRTTTEDERIENEETRKNNELNRKTAENLRVSRENAREQAEIQRQNLFEQNESVRNENENTRIKRESKRVAAEVVREANEDDRILQELDRQKKEETRETNETSRVEAEKIREQQEENREQHYNNFDEAETARIEAEKIREANENARVTAESNRNNEYEKAEKNRNDSFDLAEKNRTTIYNASELERTNNEEQRVLEESKRDTRETARVEAEKERVTAEELRIEAENARVIAEQERASAEVVREEKINEFGSQVTKNTKNIADNSKDIERAFETINDNSFIPFEGESITVEHSKVGFTKDMFIEGRTYQNLFDSNLKYKEQVKVWYSTFQDSNNLTIHNMNDKKIRISMYNISDGNCFDDTIVDANTLVNIKTRSGVVFRECSLAVADGWNEENKNDKKILILKGDYTQPNSYTPSYFEGIKSVGEAEENKVNILSHGKNLFNGVANEGWLADNDIFMQEKNTWTTDYIKLKKGVNYIRNSTENNVYYDKNKKRIKNIIGNTVSLPDDCEYVRCVYKGLKNSFQLEEGTISTSYEPYKQDKKEILLPFEGGLKGINTFKDTIEKREDGVYVLERIIKVPYQGGDENLENVITDRINSYKVREEPIEYKISELTSINLETFKDVTYVSSENEIQPNLSFKAPVDVPATISSLKVKNNTLEKENKELKGELDTKTLRLHDQDVELTNSDLDLDFRIFELEMSVGTPINLNMKGMNSMARSPYEMMKILILNNNYDREDIEYKASRYLKGGRMTQEEYNEIISLMDANELVK